MATYKVIQDIEAEDKLLGPLTLKQFIFAAIAAGFAFAAFFAVSKTGSIFLAIPFLPFIIVPGVLAAPIGRDQPTDIWLAARIRFLIKPRKRIWDQSGIKNLVTITAPKKIEKFYSDGLSQTEVRSRLKALAETIDSRGWAVKNVNLNMAPVPAFAGTGYDRLIDPASLPQSVPTVDITAADDIMDATSNPVAQHFDTLVRQATDAQRITAIERMQAAMTTTNATAPAPLADAWFLNQPDASKIPTNQAMFTTQTVTPVTATTHQDNSFVGMSQAVEPDAAEQALLDKIKAAKTVEQDSWAAHHKTIKTPEELAAEAEQQKQAAQEQAQAVTPPKNPGIVELAQTNDLSVASVAHIANRKGQSKDGEVIVNLR